MLDRGLLRMVRKKGAKSRDPRTGNHVYRYLYRGTHQVVVEFDPAGDAEVVNAYIG